MSRIILGEGFDIGSRPVYEDRCATTEIQTVGGLNLSIGIVADGVGGENKGERAAQLAIDTALNYLKNHYEQDVPTLLRNAVQAANTVVYQEVQTVSGTMGCTIAVAAILDNQTLYIANVGDSRVYLCRKNKLSQLTVDHTYATIMTWRGKLQQHEAAHHPKAGMLMRALGLEEQVTVDVGFYVGTHDEQTANERGEHGLPLTKGDSVLLCSDGLIKASPLGMPFVTSDEIVRILRAKEGDNAARTLVSIALGRNADDNVSVVLLQMPDPARRNRERVLMVGGAGIAAIISILVIMLIFTSGGFLITASRPTETPRLITLTPTMTLTPTRTPTSTPTFEPGQIGRIIFPTVGGAAQVTELDTNQVSRVNDENALRERSKIVTNGNLVKLILHDPNSVYKKDAVVLLLKNATELDFLKGNSQDHNGLMFEFRQGEVFVDTADWPRASLKLSSYNIEAEVKGSCMAVSISPAGDTVSLYCFSGVCLARFPNRVGAKITGPELQKGQQITLDTTGATDNANASVEKMSLNTITRYAAYYDQSCVQSLVPTQTPTSTPSRTRVPIQPTRQPNPYPPSGASLKDSAAPGISSPDQAKHNTLFPMSFVTLGVFFGLVGITKAMRRLSVTVKNETVPEREHTL